MAITAAHAGSATVSAAEYSMVSHSLTTASGTTAGIYQAEINFANLDDGTVYVVKIRDVTKAGDALGTVHYETVAHNQGSAPIYASPALILLPGYDISLTMQTGSGTLVQYSIRQIA